MATGIFDTVSSGSLLLALPLALAAGLVSFFSPCVLPLLPGYLSYMTGLSASDLDSGRRGRMLAGSSLFILGFSVVFVGLGSLFGGVTAHLQEHQRTISVVMGIFIIVLGFAFMGWVPFMQRDVRIHKVPAVGLAAAPLLGALFAIGWTPCLGPTLGAVITLATTPGASAGRGALLTFVYCVGLGVPFILAALGFGRFMHAIRWFRQHQRGIAIVAGSTMVVVGVLLVTGTWDDLIVRMQTSYNGYAPAI